MSANLKKYYRDLEFVSKIKNKKLQKDILKYISKNPNIYLAIKEIGVNVIEGNIKQKKLTKNKKTLLNKFKTKQSLTTCKKIVQNGGAWMWLIPLITTVIDLIK